MQFPLADPQATHHSGFVNILGNPNMGKSTLLNALVGEHMSIVTAKPQTTRHRIIGILNEDDFQIVFSDTPGYIKDPSYKMQQSMNTFIRQSFEDADLILYVTDPFESMQETEGLLEKIKTVSTPVLVILNKIDAANDEQTQNRVKQIESILPEKKIYLVSALKGMGIHELLNDIKSLIPEGPPFYPKDQLTDRPERFFVSELIRQKILELYREEIPYTCEVVVDSFKEGESKKGPIIRISATIYTMDDRKKSILLGKGGSSIRQLGSEARTEIEAFFGKHVFLELFIKVLENWRDNDRLLKTFGYQA